MTLQPVAGAFAKERYDIDDGLALSLMTTQQAKEAGLMCAAMEPWLSYPFEASELTRFFAAQRPHAPRFAVTLADTFAGALVVQRDWLRGPYVHMLAISVQFQKRGLGSALLRFVENEARSTGDRNIFIAVTETNVRAAALYRHFGFAEVARLDGLVREGKTEILMRKRLA